MTCITGSTHYFFLKQIFFAIFLLFCNVFDSPAQSLSHENNYISNLIQERRLKDEEFKSAESSPLDSLAKTTFSGLNYFSPSKKWVIRAKLERNLKADTIQMKTTTERLPLYIVYGQASFKHNGRVYKLTIFQNVGLMNKPGFENHLFVPFTDKTSGEESYGGGRYIDAQLTNSDFIDLDFNKAYNPYCVYSKKYSCPIPPSENYLDIKVKAGEKKF